MLEPYYDHDGITIYHGDCLEVLAQLDANCAGVCITDPPYNLGLKYGPLSDDAVPRHLYEGWLAERLAEARRVSSDSVVFTYSNKYLGSVEPAVLERAGLRQWRFLYWHRRSFAGDKFHGGPAQTVEPIVWASKVEKPHWNKTVGHGGRDLFEIGCVRNGRFRDVHPCPKPDPVARWLVTLFGVSGAPILDPFCGTGAFLEQASIASHCAIGIEIEERYCEIAAKRLAQQALPFDHS